MDLEQRTVRNVTMRLVPFLVLCYFVAYLDRVNVGFAKLTMSKDIGLSDTAFGLGAGIFFIAYFVFEVPSNLLLERFGARKWIARIMFTWGILSGAMAFVVGPYSFYLVRVLLGFAEAGFFPGIIFFLTLWFPAKERARIIGLFMAAIPLSSVIGSPVSGALLGLDGVLGMQGWQWLYVLEAAPALVLSVVVFFYLTDKPVDATWLAADERQWLVTRLEQERRVREDARSYSVMEAIFNPRVLGVALVYFGAVACNYGFSFFLPTIIKGFGLTNLQTGFVAAIPYVVGTVGMVWWGRRSDARKERKFHAAIPLFIAAAGIGASTLVSDPTLKIVLFTIAGFGIFSCLPVIWTLPTAYLSGPAAAGGIAVVNSVGNLSGFFGPYAMGYIKDQTGSFDGGLWTLAVCGFIGMLIVLVLPHDRKLEEAPATGQMAADYT
jgi:ACS family tartrate transporter-like MFS transporter